MGNHHVHADRSEATAARTPRADTMLMIDEIAWSGAAS
jgi:hypothetical protein